MLTLHRLGHVVDLISVIHLRRIEFLHPGDGIDAIHAFDGAFLVFAGITPRNIFGPIEMRLHRVAVFIFGDFEFIVSTVSGVGEAFTDNGIAHPIEELLVLGVGDFGLVHPKRVDRHASCRGVDAPERIGLRRTFLHRATINEHHAVGCGLNKHRATHAGHFASIGRNRALAGEARIKHQRKHESGQTN